MVPFLGPLKESIWLRVTMLALFCSTVSVGAWILANEYIENANIGYVAIGVGVVTLVAATILGKLVANYAISATDFLTKAILLVTRQESQTEPPKTNSLKIVGKEYIISLARSIYGLSPTNALASRENPFYSSLADNIPLPVIVLSKERNISFANDAALRYINMKLDDIKDQPMYDVLNLSFVSDSTLDSWLTDNETNSVVNTEIWERVRLTLPDESRKQFDMAVHYSNNDSNGVETILVLFDRTIIYERDDHDLTFVSLAVHELRTPLTIMRGYIEVFEDEIGDKLNSEQNDFMHNMSASAQQLASFVSNILNVARVEENALMLRLKEENWKEVLLGACKDMDLRARVHNKVLVYEIDDNMPAVATDKVSIYEVMNNLIDNAIKYTHTDEKIVIKSYMKDGMIETTVTDRGVGIPSALIAHVFDKFYRAHQSKNSIGGTGLGLYLSRAIIAAHGGSIWVKSKEGEGSTFGFTLPIYANVAEQISKDDNGQIIRGAHGWIKNHSLYRE